ncbi:MAG TPA: hypothetical protein VF596_17200 [Pyrinomonadaceae bacterium]|jgi:hypothetical protein
MKLKQITASVLLLVVFLNLLLLPVQAQVGDPIEITFGQPNIWSLEQAHYLLSQMRERSMRIKADELTDLDPNSAEASRINLIRQLFGLTGEFRQNPNSPSAIPSTSPTPVPSPAAFPSPITEPSPLAGTILSQLLDKDFLKKLNSDSKLNATTRLDNHVQLQYEIIAKQLTLLRDEVGPDERLVFLELPQTIYASAHDTKGKVVQTYWEIAGYSEYDRATDLDESLRKIKENYEIVKKSQQLAEEAVKTADFTEYKTYRDNIEKAIKDYETAEKRCLENPQSECKSNLTLLEAKRTTQMGSFEKFKTNNEEKVKLYDAAKIEYDEITKTREYIENAFKKLNAQRIKESNNKAANNARETIERIEQQGSLPNYEIIQRVMKSGNFASSQFRKEGQPFQSLGDYVNNRRTRAVDIIPRQSSLNINDIQETVKSSILGGAFSFLFGLGLRTNFQRQRDTFEQYLHQEIYASGFGKGENIFGWTFGPVPGTKRIASGVRTTYAVVVVPRKAEALVMNARGCYFSHKKFQPQNVMDGNETAFNGQNWKDDDDRDCSGKKQYVIPIPNGGDARGFWLTSVDYAPVEKGQKIVLSIKGRNFTSQVGVLVNGVPLQQVVELTRKLPSDDLLIRDYCENEICGKYEVIDAEEITTVFRMPKDFEGTPEISIVGPGRTVSLSELNIQIKPHGGSQCEKCNIKAKNVPFMFGTRATATPDKLTLTELQVFSSEDPKVKSSAILSGTKFTGKETIFVDGIVLNKDTEQLFISNKQYKIDFNLKKSDSVSVLIKQCTKKQPEDSKEKPVIEFCNTDSDQDITTVIKAFPVNTSQFTITNVTALRFDSVRDEMFVRIEGTGFENVKLSKVDDIEEKPSVSAIIPVSSRELLVKIAQPRSTVKITLRNLSGAEISTVVIRPPDIDVIEGP